MTAVSRDRGSAGVEAAFAVVALLAVGFFVVGALRVTGSSSDVDSAAHAGARAAAVGVRACGRAGICLGGGPSGPRPIAASLAKT